MEITMRLTRNRSLLSPFALAAALTVCAPMAALAMPVAQQPDSAASRAATPADYLYQGHHYHYRHDGHYYDHRDYKNSHWSYH
jgi:hypothetical protein